MLRRSKHGAWDTSGEIFIHSQINDISDGPDVPEPDPKAELFAMKMTRALAEIRGANEDMPTDELIAQLQAQHPDLADEAMGIVEG